MMPNKITTEIMLDRFFITHGNLYDYSLFKYENMRSKCIIICEKHGEFEQLPGAHARGEGCQKCAYKNKRISEEVIRERLDKFYNNKYIYPNLENVNMRTKIEIICPAHGVFVKKLQKHLEGQGCAKCKKEETSKNGKWFNYGKIKYVLRYTNNTELGNSPGIFYKLIFTHKSGFKFLKVGITSRNIYSRYKKKIYDDFTYEILEEIKTTNLKSAELELAFLQNTKLKRFEFPADIDFNGKSECFELED